MIPAFSRTGTRLRVLALGAVFSVVVSAVAPAVADDTSFNTSISKTGVSGQRYAWAPGTC